MMNIRHEVIPFVGIVVVVGACMGFLLNAIIAGVAFIVLGTACLIYFFRDPNRTPPPDIAAILSGADGRVMSIMQLPENTYLNVDCVRISVFLSIFNVHVNRSPLSGQAKFIGYFPGKKVFAFREKASEVNQHNKILIEGAGTRCLIAQIVGPVARRVVYWLNHDTPVSVKAGDRIGMMKFGSRLDIYLPAAEVTVLAESGDRVRAGETVIARIKSVESEGAKMNQKNTGEV
jgi:phosphatidylserine decarboxylase